MIACAIWLGRTAETCTRGIGCVCRNERKPDQSMTPAQRVDRILAKAVGSDVSSWEKYTFLLFIRQWKSLTESQEYTLRGIERRVLGEDDDES